MESKIHIFTYSQHTCEADVPEPSVTIEQHGDSFGMCVPMDGPELRYFSATEMRTIAYAILGVVDDE